jgi:hypothetical protein
MYIRTGRLRTRLQKWRRYAPGSFVKFSNHTINIEKSSEHDWVETCGYENYAFQAKKYLTN